MKRSDGWVRSGLGTAALLIAFTALVLLPIGWVLVHVSDAVFGRPQ